MSWLSDVGKGLVSSLGSGLIGSVFNKHSTDHANDLNVQNYSQRYQLAVKDMQAAGLNPILAATSGIGGNIQGVSGFSASVPSIGTESSALANSALSRKNSNNADALAKSNIAANAASANKLAADADAIRQGIEFNRVYFPYEQDLKKQTVENAKKQGELIQKQADAQDFQYKFVLPSMVNLYTQQGIQAASSAALNSQNAALSAANTRMIDQQAQDYERYGINPHNVTGWAAPLARLGDRVKNFLKNRYYPDD